MEDILVPIFLFAAIAAPVIMLIVSRARTRQLMIERGIFGADYAAVLGAETRMRTLSGLKWGLVLGGIGLGLVLLSVLGFDQPDEPAAFGLVILGAAAGFLGYYLITRNEPLGAGTPAVSHSAPAASGMAAAAPAHEA